MRMFKSVLLYLAMVPVIAVAQITPKATTLTATGEIANPVPVISCNYPLPGQTSVTLYKSDYLNADGTPTSKVLYILTTGHSESGIKVLSSGGGMMGSGMITGVPAGTKDASIGSYFYGGYYPMGDTTVNQSFTDGKGVQVKRSFVIHLLGLNPNATVSAKVKAVFAAKK